MAESQPAEELQRIAARPVRPTIGYMTSSIYSESSQLQWLSMVDATQHWDVNLISFPGSALRTSGDNQGQANILYSLVSAASVDGLVSWASSIGNLVTDDENRAFHERYHPLPVVAIGQAWEGIPALSMESYDGMHDVVTHLIEVHQCRRIAFIRGPEANLQARARYRAYVDALQAHGLPVDPNLITPPTGWSSDIGEQAIRLLLDARQLRPQVDLDAVVAASDSLLLGALQVLAAYGIQVPADLAVAGFNDVLQGQVHIPPLTTVAAPFHELGYRAIELVLALLEGRPVAAETQIPTQMVIRQSCGCMDPLVEEALSGSAVAGDKTIESVLISRRAEIAAAMVQALGDADEAVPSRAERLLTALLAELKGETPGLFIRELGTVLRQTVTTGGNVAAWHGAISALRRQTLACAHDRAFVLASDLWQQARVAISGITQRAQAQSQLQVDQQAQALRDIGTALLTTFDPQGLIDELARWLPTLGIPSCYLCLYEAPRSYQYSQPLPEWSRLMLAYNENGRIEVGPEGQRFPSRQLLPEGVLPLDRRFNLVATPLYFQNNQLGFVLFEPGPREASVYEVLRVQISSALQGAVLIQRVENRAFQFQTVTQVSRATSSILDLDELAQQVVDVIQERFNLYYVGLFLTDQAGEGAEASSRWAVLRAATGAAGRELVARGHRLEIADTSMVGWAVSQRKARIALDVGHEGEVVRFDNPLLPDTRSEMALPLISRGEVIGALDVQSVKPEAFSDEDIAILQTMADQVALAIGNARLFQQVQDSLEAERRAYGKLSHEAWRTLLQTGSGMSYVCDEYGLSPAESPPEPHMYKAAQTGASVIAADDEQAVALPIKVRDQVIGVINVHKPQGGPWSREQITLVETLTEQLGVALESARLYQDTQRRAAQEQLIGQVTARVRESLDVTTVLKTAAQEIARSLGLAALDVRLAPPSSTEQS